MENFQTIIESIQGTIKIVTYNKPKRKNAIDIDMYKRVTKILHDCANDSTVSMMVFTGAGDYFSSGNDLVAARTVHTPSFLQVLHDFIEAFITFPKLLVAVVNGPAVGIAVTTLPLCDLVFAAENAFFYTPFGKLGFTAEGCSSYTFPRIIGHGKALEMLLFDQKMNAKEAFDYGLVNYVYKPEEIQSQVWNKLTEISNVSNDLVTTTKRLIRSSIQDKLLKVNDEEIRLLNEAWAVRNQKQDGCTIKKDFYNRFSTDPVRGMSRDKAAELLKFYGHNALTPPTQNGWTKVLFKSMCTGFSVLIWLGALLCLGAYLIEASSKPNPSRDNLYLGCVLIAVDVICGLFSFFQNYKSSQIMKTFNNMIPTYAQCTRDGVLQAETNVRDLVRGDLVRVQAGNIVPGDIRIIDSKGFKVDNSSLTGESVAVCRSNSEGTANILESPNVAFFSTQCVEGWAIGIVMCTGDLTALGRVAGLATRIQPKPSPLSREISRFMRYMSIWAICLGTFVACASLALGYPFMQTTIFVIGIIVANIPEGLQPTVTASLTLTAQRMVKKNCLIKNLDAIEALGACTTICSDKTGTLTENKMCVLDVWTWNKIQTVSRTSFHNMLRNSQAHAALIRCGALCSTATLKPDGTIHGDASETAILNFINKHGDLGVLRKQYPKVAEIPFNSAHKYQVTVHLDISNSKYIVMMKGAPEIIISRCETVAIDKDTKTLSKEMKLMADTASINMAKTGQRILALADLVLDARTYPLGYKFDTEDVNFPVDKLRLLGVFGLMDPPRKEVLSAIQRVRAAGVRVMMVTGDHPETARAVAHDVGIATAACHVVTGADLRGMTPDLLDWTIDKYYELVFARTSPTQKLQIVEACQRRGGIVAVTGDGVNDAPALRRADIGISMGITGSQVSKQTADIILMDDNFATIVTGIEEGRKIFDNLKKSICYILISNVPEIFPVLMFILFSIPLPLGVMTILCVDLGTDMWPAVSLAYERAESDVMARPPRRGEKLVTGRMIRLAYGHLGLLEVAAGMFAYFVLMAEHGFYPDILFGLRADWDNEAVSDLKDSLGQEWTYAGRMQVQRAAQAAYFVAVVMMQMMNGVVSKTRYNSIVHVGMKNKVLNMGLAVELLVACLVCYCPGINTFFKAYPLRIEWWFLAVPFVVFMFIFDEFRRYCIRRELFGGWFNMLTYY